MDRICWRTPRTLVALQAHVRDGPKLLHFGMMANADILPDFRVGLMFNMHVLDERVLPQWNTFQRLMLHRGDQPLT